MRQAQVRCMGKERSCGARLVFSLREGSGLEGQSEPCPKCGETAAARYILVQARLRWPNRLWVVDTLRLAGTEAAPSLVRPARPTGRHLTPRPAVVRVR